MASKIRRHLSRSNALEAAAEKENPGGSRDLLAKWRFLFKSDYLVASPSWFSVGALASAFTLALPLPLLAFPLPLP